MLHACILLVSGIWYGAFGASSSSARAKPPLRLLCRALKLEASCRTALRRRWGAVTSALLHDLTEGRPDCKRLTPAVWKLTGARLHAQRRGLLLDEGW